MVVDRIIEPIDRQKLLSKVLVEVFVGQAFCDMGSRRGKGVSTLCHCIPLLVQPIDPVVPLGVH